MEPDVVQPTERRRVLVLAADRLAQHIDLDPARPLRQPPRPGRPPAPGGERREQADGEAAAGTHPGAGRQVADRGDLQWLADLHQPHRLADDLMADVVQRLGQLGPGIADADARLEPAVDGHVDVPVDRRAEHGPGLMAVKARRSVPLPAKLTRYGVCEMIMVAAPRSGKGDGLAIRRVSSDGTALQMAGLRRIPEFFSHGSAVICVICGPIVRRPG